MGRKKAQIQMDRCCAGRYQKTGGCQLVNGCQELRSLEEDLEGEIEGTWIDDRNRMITDEVWPGTRVRLLSVLDNTLGQKSGSILRTQKKFSRSGVRKDDDYIGNYGELEFESGSAWFTRQITILFTNIYFESVMFKEITIPSRR